MQIGDMIMTGERAEAGWKVDWILTYEESCMRVIG